MHRAAWTIGNIPMWVGKLIAAYHDDLDVTLVLDEHGELEAVEVASHDEPGQVATIRDGADYRDGSAIWWAASLAMIEEGDEIREAANFHRPERERQSAPLYGVGFRGGRYAA
jgi:hypothetical protein